MKKLLLVTACCLCLALKVFAQANVKDISLNGILKSDMDMYTSNYYDHLDNYKTPAQQSIWFDYSTVRQMIALINEENIKIKAGANPKDTIDGVRVYIGSTSQSNKTPDVLILVTTTHGAPDPNNRMSGFHHNDLYSHDMNNGLFKDLNAIRGQRRERMETKAGEILYDSCTNCSTIADCPDNKPHYIPRKMAEDMVKNFGKRPMKTRSEWFDLDLLRALDIDKHHTGFRLYFSKYGEHDVDPHQIVADMDALIWVPTEHHGIWPFNKKNHDYFDCNITSNYLKKYFEKFARLWTGGGGPGGVDNGELCPLNCN